jgi:hypothetical protein
MPSSRKPAEVSARTRARYPFWIQSSGAPDASRRSSGTTWEGEVEIEADEVIAATGFRAPVRDLPRIGVAMVNDGRMPAQTPYWESVSVPGIYFAGNVMGASAGLRKHGATSSAASVNGFRYNARVLAQHIAERHCGVKREQREFVRAGAVAFLRDELAHAPELWIQKGYLARVVETGGGYRDGGIVPLADYVDRDTGDSCAVTVEYGPDGAVTPVVYVRRRGRLAEHALPTDPLHRFDTPEHRRQLDALIS